MADKITARVSRYISYLYFTKETFCERKYPEEENHLCLCMYVSVRHFLAEQTFANWRIHFSCIHYNAKKNWFGICTSTTVWITRWCCTFVVLLKWWLPEHTLLCAIRHLAVTKIILMHYWHCVKTKRNVGNAIHVMY